MEKGKRITDKDQFRPFTFYYWEEKYPKKTLKDVCFIIEIDGKASPGRYQCFGIEIQQISSDLNPGSSHNYNYRWRDHYGEYLDTRNYKIHELSVDDIDKKQFFDWLFDPNSRLNQLIDRI